MDTADVKHGSPRGPREILAAAMDHHAAGHLDEAERDYLAVVDCGYRVIDVLPLLAGLASRRGDVPTALEHWTRLLEHQPEHLFGLMEKGSLLHRTGQWSEAVTCLEAAERIDGRHPTLLLNLGVALVDAGRGHDALMVFRRLAELQPGNRLIEHQIRRISSALVPFWHIPMLNDQARNDAFETAIKQAIARHGPAAQVLDIGAGSGLLSMMAARAGARNIVCCESVPVITEAARTIVARNGYDGQIRVIGKKSSQLVIGDDLERRADILVSEILSSDLLAESVLATFEDAMARLVRDDATVVPRAVTAKGCLIESAQLAKYAFVGEVSGFDVSPFTSLAAQRLPVHGKQTSWRRLSADHDLVQIDLRARQHDSAGQNLMIPVTADGVAVGVMQWMHVDVAEGIVFENPPDEYSDGGWLQIVHTFSRPIPVTAGAIFELTAGHDRTSLVLVPAGPERNVVETHQRKAAS